MRRAPEIVWAVIPAIALALVFAGTWRVMHRVSDAGDVPLPAPPPAGFTDAPTLLADVQVAPPGAAAPAPAPIRREVRQRAVHELAEPLYFDSEDEEMQPR